jgi:type III secretion system low calcium response chaperone LcrH/SycD
MKTIKEAVDASMEIMGDKIPKKDKERFSDMMKQVFEDGLLAKDVMGFDNQTMEAIYGQAYNLYNSGKYEQSTTIFRLLVALNPTEFKYVLGLAASYHLQKKFQKAIEMYMLAAYLHKRDPVPFYHISDCYIQMNDPPCAILALNDTITRCHSNSIYDHIKKKSELMLDSLQARNNQENSKKHVKKAA